MRQSFIWIAAAVITLTSACSDWLDIAPKTQIKSEYFFDSEDGFTSALAGVYIRMTNDVTYGRNLSFLFLEKLVHRYDEPNVSVTSETIYDYRGPSKGTLNQIWQGMYQNIANINNLLKNLDAHGQKVIKTPGYYDLIKGEALALRAFHYFDLLRMWGPIYKNEPTALALPYRDAFTSEKVPLKTSEEILDLIVSDLNQASGYLKEDPMGWINNAAEPFLAFRGHRLNKYAVKALLARVYLYKGGADILKAATLAQEVIQHSGLQLVQNNMEDISMFQETLFGLNMFNMARRQEAYFRTGGASGTELWLKERNWQEAFDGTAFGVNDIRFRSGYGFIFNGQFGAMSRKYLTGPSAVYNEKIPLIRLSEMYLILSEVNNDATYINQLRNARGISKNNNVTFNSVPSENVEIIQKEYQKEYFGEGQYFYFLKRHAVKDFYRCPETLRDKGGMSKLQYVFPIPDNEIEYGLVEQTN